MPLMEPGGGSRGNANILVSMEKLECAWERRDQDEPFGGVGFAMAISTVGVMGESNRWNWRWWKIVATAVLYCNKGHWEGLQY